MFVKNQPRYILMASGGVVLVLIWESLIHQDSVRKRNDKGKGNTKKE